MGKAKANVLPEPVLAAPIQSLPPKMAGIQFSCMGVACFRPLEEFIKFLYFFNYKYYIYLILLIV